MNGVEQVETINSLSPRERLRYPGNLVALHARFLTGGDALSPHKLDLTLVTRESFRSFEERDYSPFVKASARERKTYWYGKEENNFKRQQNRWENGLVDLIITNKQFFLDDLEGKQWGLLFAKLGLDTQHVTRESAAELYSRYFIGEKKESNIKQFVADVVSHYKTDGAIDYERLNADLPGIQWLATIFGTVSSEVVAQLVDAEVKLQNEPDRLVEQANTTHSGGAIRLNVLLQKEKELLNFLWEGQQAGTSTRHIRVKWEYQRPGDPRIFPQDFSFVEEAKLLKESKPHLYGNLDDETLAREMEEESHNLQKLLVSYGLSPQELHNMTIGFIEKEVLNHYRSFVEKQYGVKLPTTEKINVIPIWKKMSELHNPTGRALAFVNGLSPYIFLDMQAIANAAKRLTNKDWQSLSREELGELMKRLIREIKPHEYTHLASDLAYWNLVAEESGQPDSTLLSRVGKLGLLLAKPKAVNGRLVFAERGRGLMEAVTVELTRQWSRHMNAHLDIPAYAAERAVLYALRDKLHREEKIGDHEVFKKFVQGYFDRRGFYDLVKFVNHNRPHYFSMIYALMDYEERKARRNNASPFYSMTLHFIHDSLDPYEKKELLASLNQINLSPMIRNSLKTKLS